MSAHPLTLFSPLYRHTLHKNRGKPWAEALPRIADAVVAVPGQVSTCHSCRVMEKTRKERGIVGMVINILTQSRYPTYRPNTNDYTGVDRGGQGCGGGPLLHPGPWDVPGL